MSIPRLAGLALAALMALTLVAPVPSAAQGQFVVRDIRVEGAQRI